MRNVIAQIRQATGLRRTPRLTRPSVLPTVRSTALGRAAWVLSGVATVLMLVVLGAWLDIASEERAHERALDEHAVWLGGWLDGRNQERKLQQALQDPLALQEQLAEAYRRGLADDMADGMEQGCPVPSHATLMVQR